MRAASVGDLLDQLHGVGVELLSDPAGRDLAVRRPVLHDGPPPSTRDGLLLLAGMRPDAAEASAVVLEAAAAGFRSVAVKPQGADPAPLAAVADEAGVALLAVHDEVEWLHLAGILGTIVDAAVQRDLAGPDAAVGDLFGLANAVAAAVGGATAIEDVKQRILAYSTVPGQPIDEDRREGILGRQVPDLPENEAQYRELYRSTGVLRFDPVPPAMGRLAVAVRAGAELLGSIWVVDTGESRADVEVSLVAAADMAALHLLRARSAEDVVRHQRGELVRGLLAGDLPAAPTVDRLGLATGGPYVVLAFEPAAGADVSTSRITDLVTLHLDARLGPTAACTTGGAVHVLAAGGRVPTPARLVRLCREVASTAASSLRTPLVAAVGRLTDDPALVQASRSDADRVLDLLRSDPGTTVASAEELADRLALASLAGSVATSPDLESRSGRAIMAHDAAHGTSYSTLLLAWLESQGEVSACAARLTVHPNTVRYRLRRAAELFDLDLDDPDQLLVLWLTLRCAILAR